MPSHRSPSFSRLKDVLAQLPQRQTLEEPTDAPPATGDTGTISTDSVKGERPGHEVLEIQSTAAVQQQSSQMPAGRSTLAARPGKAKAVTRPSTFRLAVELQDALKAVAEYNGLNMTDIVAESIWLHLQSFEWPPGSDQLRQNVRRLF